MSPDIAADRAGSVVSETAECCQVAWADIVPGDKVADVSGTFWEVARIDPPRHGMRRVRYVGSGHDWHYWTGEVRTVRRG